MKRSRPKLPAMLLVLALGVGTLPVTACSGDTPRGPQPTPTADTSTTGTSTAATDSSWSADGDVIARRLGPDEADGRAALAAEPPPGTTAAGEPTDLTLEAGATFPRGGLTLTRALSAPVPAGQTAALAYLDPDHGDWIPVPTTIGSDRRTLRTVVPHLSVWDTIYGTLGELTGSRADPPDCSGGGQPRWVADVEYFDDINAMVRWCYRSDPGDSSKVVVKVAANRPWGFAVRPRVKTSWDYTTTPLAGGLQTLLLSGEDAALAPVRRLLTGVYFLPPGGQVHLGLSESAVRPAPSGQVVTAKPEPAMLLSGLAWDALGFADSQGYLTLSDSVAAFSMFVQIAQCTHELATAVSKKDIIAAGRAMWTCLVGSYDEVADVIIDVLSRHTDMKPKDIATQSRRASKALLYVLAASWGFRIGEYASDLGTVTPSVTILARAPLGPDRMLTLSGWNGIELGESIAQVSREKNWPFHDACGRADVFDFEIFERYQVSVKGADGDPHRVHTIGVYTPRVVGPAGMRVGARTATAPGISGPGLPGPEGARYWLEQTPTGAWYWVRSSSDGRAVTAFGIGASKAAAVYESTTQGGCL